MVAGPAGRGFKFAFITVLNICLVISVYEIDKEDKSDHKYYWSIIMAILTLSN